MSKKKPAKKDKILEEIKRHNKVLMEHMEKQVKTVAEQHGSVIGKLEEHDEEFKKIDQRFGRIEEVAMENRKDVKELQSGQKRLESGQKRLESGHEELERKLDTVTENHEKRIHKLEAVR
ncbi:MAG: hypothetical protein NG740_02715 [Omnitrophica bacterium]|nr:hypothetical protein [Candidatus Omnitrophota bacterium]